MKPYFTKWIPIGGEIQDDNWAFKKDGTLIYVNKAAAKYLSEDWIKAQLSLCTRNIQPGDKCRTTADINGSIGEREVKERVDGFLTVDTSDIQKGKTLTLLRREWFKVTGPISKGAKWVKEGDEFDEEEVAKAICKPGKEQLIISESLQEWEEWIPNNGFIKCIAIKCPLCGDFK